MRWVKDGLEKLLGGGGWGGRREDVWNEFRGKLKVWVASGVVARLQYKDDTRLGHGAERVQCIGEAEEPAVPLLAVEEQIRRGGLGSCCWRAPVHTGASRKFRMMGITARKTSDG